MFICKHKAIAVSMDTASAAVLDEASIERAQLLDSVSESMVGILMRGRGPPILNVPQDCHSIVMRGFQTGKSCMEIVRMQTTTGHKAHPALIRDGEDSADVNGYHACGGLSRYNLFREGFVFSNNTTYDVEDSDFYTSNDSAVLSSDASLFRTDMSALYDTMFEVAQNVLSQIAASLSLPSDFFDTAYGPIKEHSQWHLKRYHPYGTTAENQTPRKIREGHQRTVDGRIVLLPVHTDPSLISLVVISRQNDNSDCAVHFDGAMGLEYHDDTDPDNPWHPVPASGSGAIIIFAGSVLHRISGGIFPATRHRVAVMETEVDAVVREERVVATFFFRPAPHAILRLLPSPSVLERHEQNTTLNCKNYRGAVKHDKDMSFSEWKRKVSQRYEKKKPTT